MYVCEERALRDPAKASSLAVHGIQKKANRSSLCTEETVRKERHLQAIFRCAAKIYLFVITENFSVSGNIPNTPLTFHIYCEDLRTDVCGRKYDIHHARLIRVNRRQLGWYKICMWEKVRGLIVRHLLQGSLLQSSLCDWLHPTHSVSESIRTVTTDKGAWHTLRPYHMTPINSLECVIHHWPTMFFNDVRDTRDLDVFSQVETEERRKWIMLIINHY